MPFKVRRDGCVWFTCPECKDSWKIGPEPARWFIYHCKIEDCPGHEAYHPEKIKDKAPDNPLKSLSILQRPEAVYLPLHNVVVAIVCILLGIVGTLTFLGIKSVIRAEVEEEIKEQLPKSLQTIATDLEDICKKLKDYVERLEENAGKSPSGANVPGRIRVQEHLLQEESVLTKE